MKKETPRGYCKRTGRNYIYIEYWTGDGSHMQSWIPGLTDKELSKIVVPALELAVDKDSQRPTYDGSWPHEPRNR